MGKEFSGEKPSKKNSSSKHFDFDGLKAFVLNLLDQGLNPKLYYHCVDHTIAVESSVIEYSKTENITETELLLLRTAALFHDSGYIDLYKKNEPIAKEKLESIAPKFGYSSQDISSIGKMILSTTRGLEPQNTCEKILCDADHDYLGREDYHSIAQKLFDELLEYEGTITEEEWLQRQIHYLAEEHIYYTNSAKKLRQKGKERRILELKEQLNLFYLKK